MADIEVLTEFHVTNDGSQIILTTWWRQGTQAEAPETKREECFTDTHKLQVRLLGLAREIDWVLVA